MPLAAPTSGVRHWPRRTPEEGHTMTKDIALKTAVATQVRVNGWKNTAIQRINARSDKGQTSVEYLGIIAVVVGIVVILITTNFGQVIADAIKTQIAKVAK
jgi:Flp pilus assembly pilin Flp